MKALVSRYDERFAISVVLPFIGASYVDNDEEVGKNTVKNKIRIKINKINVLKMMLKAKFHLGP